MARFKGTGCISNLYSPNSAFQLPTEISVKVVGKSSSTFDLNTNIVVVGNGGAKINKLVYSFEGIAVS